MIQIAVTAPRVIAPRWWVALAILLLLGLTFAVAESIRIERTKLLGATDDGRLVVTEAGQRVLVGHRCRLLMGPYSVPLSWSC